MQVGSGKELSYAFSTSQTILAMCQGEAGSQIASVSVTVITNSMFDPEMVTMQEVPALVPLPDDLPGQVWAELIDYTPFSACFAGWGWQAIMTTLEPVCSNRSHTTVTSLSFAPEDHYCFRIS